MVVKFTDVIHCPVATQLNNESGW